MIGGRLPNAASVNRPDHEPLRVEGNMTWREPILLALAVLFGATASSAQDRRGRSDQDVLIQLERDWDAAFFHKDLRFIEAVLADEFIATYDDGSRGDKAEELKLAAEFNQRIDSSTLDEFMVQIYGDAAVVWFTRHLVGPSKGNRLEVTYRFLDVFVRRADRWQCVASQSAKVMP